MAPPCVATRAGSDCRRRPARRCGRFHCEREVDELSFRGGRVYLHLGPAATSRRGGSRARVMAEVDPDQEAALHRLRAAFGFVEVLRIVDHDDEHDQDDGEPLNEGEEAPLADRVASIRGRRIAAVHDPLVLVRVGPQQLVGGRPAQVLSGAVPLQIPGAEEPAAAAVERAGPTAPSAGRGRGSRAGCPAGRGGPPGTGCRSAP